MIYGLVSRFSDIVSLLGCLNNKSVTKTGINIYPTYLDGGSQPHLNHEVIRTEPTTTWAFPEEAAAHGCGADGELHRSREGVSRVRLISESPP